MRDPIDDNTHYRWKVFYFNKEDERIIVPKRQRGLGFTFNFAQPATYLVLATLLFIIYWLGKG